MYCANILYPVAVHDEATLFDTAEEEDYTETALEDSFSTKLIYMHLANRVIIGSLKLPGERIRFLSKGMKVLLAKLTVFSQLCKYSNWFAMCFFFTFTHLNENIV